MAAGTRDLEKYRDTAQVCRDEVRKAKAHLELSLAVKSKKQRSYRYFSSERMLVCKPLKKLPVSLLKNMGNPSWSRLISLIMYPS